MGYRERGEGEGDVRKGGEEGGGECLQRWALREKSI